MKFRDVIGNERAIEQIRRMVDSDNIAHALLLHGEPGVPKLALALATAQYIHCTNRIDGDSCGMCPSCLQHQSMNHADTFYSYPVINKKASGGEKPVSEDFDREWKKFISEDVIAEDYERWLSIIGNENAQPIIYASESDNIVRKMSLSAYTAKYKVLVMWQADKMNKECSNKLLKLIEEPESDCIFLLTTDNVKGILPTIYSRTQRIELRKPSTQQIAEYIARNGDIDMTEALALAAPADGNVMQALRNMDHGSETHDFHDDFVRLMRLAYMRDMAGLKEWSEDIAEYKREKSQRFLNYASRMVRENYIYNLATPSLNYETESEAQFSKNFARFINEENVERLLKLFGDAARDIRGNGNAKIILFDVAIKTTILIKK
jgi:DNA polymerase-3 subunit delta'